MDKYIRGRDLLVNFRTMIWALNNKAPNTWIDDYSMQLYEMQESTQAMLHMWDTHLEWNGVRLRITVDYYRPLLGRYTLILNHIRELPAGGMASHGYNKESLEEIWGDLGEILNDIDADS